MPNTHLLRRSFNSWISSDLRHVGPYWLQLLWSGLFAVALALIFTLLGFALNARGADWTDWDNWRRWLGLNLFVCGFISYFIHALFEIVTRVIGRDRIMGWSQNRKALLFGGIPMVGVAISWPIAVSLTDLRFTIFDGPPAVNNVNGGMLLFVLMCSAMINLYFTARTRAERAERREAEARLRLLQGQIEPHFLFNTLANVVSLIDADPRRARLMLESFIDYLRSSLGGLRRDDHTLGHELALVEAYLRVLGLRMDTRLRFEIDVPDAMRTLPLPALLLQPLVENAVQHGLEPKIEGGSVTVRARTEGGRLLLTVSDDGLGLQAAGQRPAGSGTALANIRERLSQAFGSSAELRLSDAAGGGTVARIELPLEPASPDA